MDKIVRLTGDRKLLEELCRELNAKGVQASIRQTAFACDCGNVDGITALQITGIAATLVLGTITAYLKNRRGQAFLEFDGKKISVSGKNTKETETLLAAGVLALIKAKPKRARRRSPI